MKTYKMGFKAYFFLILFAFVAGAAFWFAYMSVTEQISFEFKIGNGNANLFICFLFVLVGVSHLTSFVILLYQIIKNKNIAILLDENGMHNTFIFMMLGAAMLVLPVKQIPWEAVKEIKEEKGVCAVRVNPDMIIANKIVKKYLKSGSFMCGQPFAKPMVTEGDIRQFKNE